MLWKCLQEDSASEIWRVDAGTAGAAGAAGTSKTTKMLTDCYSFYFFQEEIISPAMEPKQDIDILVLDLQGSCRFLE